MNLSWCLDPPTAAGPAVASGVVRQCPEDFLVFEDPVCEPDGAGEHSWLKVRKRNANTNWVAEQLSRHAGVAPRHVSYAGLKDRVAVTEQWFSVHLPGKADPDWASLDCEEFQVLESKRHSRKLRRGALRGNRFQIQLRQLQGDNEAISQRLAEIVKQGIPNYFGAQRFGRQGGNLAAAEAMFSGTAGKIRRHQRSLYLSAARALLFNRVLCERVHQGLWNQALPGDVLQLEGKRGRFVAEEIEELIIGRLAALEIHPTGPLWGRGSHVSDAVSAKFEWNALQPFELWRRGLEDAGLEQDRRPLRVKVRDLEWEFLSPKILRLCFALPAGSYATVLLRELLGNL